MVVNAFVQQAHDIVAELAEQWFDLNGAHADKWEKLGKQFCEAVVRLSLVSVSWLLSKW